MYMGYKNSKNLSIDQLTSVITQQFEHNLTQRKYVMSFQVMDRFKIKQNIKLWCAGAADCVNIVRHIKPISEHSSDYYNNKHINDCFWKFDM